MPAEEAHDTTQVVLESLTPIVRMFATERRPLKLHAMARRVALHKYVDWVRERVRRNSLLEDIHATAYEWEVSKQNAGFYRIELLDLVEKALLSPKERELWSIWMGLYLESNGVEPQKLSAQVAAECGMAPANVRSILARARAKIEQTAGGNKRKCLSQR